jgi:hypothetical protein
MVPKFVARCTLAIINIIILTLSAILLYFGVTGLQTFDLNAGTSGRGGTSPTTTAYNASSGTTSNHTTNGGDSIDYILNPFRTCLFIASFMMLSGVLGLYSAFARHKKKSCCKCTMFFHIVVSFVGVACLIYGACFVYIFADDADEIIVIFWSFTKDSLPSSMTQTEAVAWFHAHLTGAAGVLVFCAVLQLICIVCDSHILGHDLTARRIVISTNVGTMVLGLLMVVVSFMENVVLGHTDVILPYLGGSVGLFALFVSTIGIVAVCNKRRPRLLCCYAFMMFTLTTALVTVSVLAFQKRDRVKQFVQTHWTTIEKKVIGFHITQDDFVRRMHMHMNLIGLSASILACMLLFNTGAAICFWFTQRKRIGDYNAAERKELFDGSSEDEDMDDYYDDEEYDDDERKGGRGGRGKRRRPKKRRRRRRKRKERRGENSSSGDSYDSYASDGSAGGSEGESEEEGKARHRSDIEMASTKRPSKSKRGTKRMPTVSM